MYISDNQETIQMFKKSIFTVHVQTYHHICLCAKKVLKMQDMKMLEEDRDM